MKKKIDLSKMLLCGALGLAVPVSSASAVTYQDLEKLSVDRTVLPIKEPVAPTITEMDARNIKEPPELFKVTAPKDAPNIVILSLIHI